MSKHRMSALCLAAIGIALPVAASAQATPPEPASVRRPYRGLFGGPADPSLPQSLVLTASAYTAYDDNILEGLTDGRASNSWMQRSGTYWGTSGGIDYLLSKPGERVSFGAHTNAQVQYREAAGDSSLAPYFNGEVHMDAKLTRSLTLGLGQSASYAPNYSTGFSPVDGGDFGDNVTVVPDPDFALFPLQTMRTVSRVSLSQAFGRYTQLSGSYQFRVVEVDEAEIDDTRSSRFHDYRSNSGSLRFTHQKPLTPHATLVLGYGIRVSDGNANTAEPRVMHNVNAGVNYSKALSFSRRTSLSFGTGSAIVVSRRLEIPDAESRTRFRLLGNANLVHELGRTWTAQLAYARALVSRDGFGELYFTDGLTATVGGLVSRRLSVNASALWSLSTLDRPGQNRHTNVSAAAQANYALTQYLAVYARYLYYQYEYDDDIPLDARFARGLERQGVRVGLTTSIPLIR